MKKIAFISASWHKDIVEQSKNGFYDKLKEEGFDTSLVDTYTVPGSLELPLAAKKLSLENKYKLIVVAGFLVNGGIYRHEFVAQAVLDGIVAVQLETKVPILSVVLTPIKFDENNSEDVDFFTKHLFLKGREAAESMLHLFDNFESSI